MKPTDLHIRLRRAIRDALGTRNSAAVIEVLNLPAWVFSLDEMHQKNAQELRSLREALKEFEAELGQALQQAERIKRMLNEPFGLQVPGSDDYRATSWLADCARMIGEARDMSDRMATKGGRPKKTGPFQAALAVWGALDRAKVPPRKRPAVIRACFGAIDVKPSLAESAIRAAEAESAIKKVRNWFKNKRN